MDTATHPLRAYRLSQTPRVKLAELAKRAGTTKASLSRIENGKQVVGEALLLRLIAATGIAASELRPDLAKLFKSSEQPSDTTNPRRIPGRTRRAPARTARRAAA